jgi:MoxR-like ATPase
MAIIEFRNKILSEMKRVIVGQEGAIEEIILAFLAGGHIILEGVPGLAKTGIARTFAKIIGLKFNRIQFTPDLMPSDILGTMVYNLEKSQFVFRKGPAFTNVLLADEINRTSPKTQAGLLEVMQERQITIDGKAYPLDAPFMVLATQNPIEFEGTYPLPEAQLDRFLMKVNIDYPGREVEINVMRMYENGFDMNIIDNTKFDTIELSALDECRKEFKSIKVEDAILEYIMDIMSATREHSALLLGVSTRAGLSLLNLAKYHAGFDGRNYVIPDDVKTIAKPVLRHRLVLQADAEIEGYKADDIIDEIVNKQKVPR